MKFSQYLKEEYVTKEPNFRHDIFINPSAKEIKEAVNDNGEGFVRFIADFKNKDLYVFSSDLLHSSALKALNTERGLYDWSEGWDDLKSKANNYYSFGTARVVGNKLEFYRSDTGHALGLKNVETLKWTTMNDVWLKKWFVDTSYIKSYIESIPKDIKWH